MPPWLQTLRPWGSAHRPPSGMVKALQALWPDSLAGNLPQSASGLPVRVLAASTPMGALAYESHIARTGELPTRDLAHDWYNGICWLAWPQTKQMLNRLQVHEGLGADPLVPPWTGESAPSGVQASEKAVGSNGRTRRRDALTLFDENGAVVVTALADLPAWLSGHDWATLFVKHRAQWGNSIEPWVVGHALLEKLENPRLDLCAHARVCYLAPPEWQQWQTLDIEQRRMWLDRWLAADLEQRLQTPADLRPLPLMGIPDWHPGNADSDFYNNRAVFRGRRAANAS